MLRLLRVSLFYSFELVVGVSKTMATLSNDFLGLLAFGWYLCLWISMWSLRPVRPSIRLSGALFIRQKSPKSRFKHKHVHVASICHASGVNSINKFRVYIIYKISAFSNAWTKKYTFSLCSNCRLFWVSTLGLLVSVCVCVRTCFNTTEWSKQWCTVWLSLQLIRQFYVFLFFVSATQIDGWTVHIKIGIRSLCISGLMLSRRFSILKYLGSFQSSCTMLMMSTYSHSELLHLSCFSLLIPYANIFLPSFRLCFIYHFEIRFWQNLIPNWCRRRQRKRRKLKTGKLCIDAFVLLVGIP